MLLLLLCRMCSAAQLMPVLLDACSSPHSDLRQCAVYGVGLGASLAAELFKPHAAAALAAVQAIVTAPVSRVLASWDRRGIVNHWLGWTLGVLLSVGFCWENVWGVVGQGRGTMVTQHIGSGVLELLAVSSCAGLGL
jgi:hypothetical protein